MIQFDVITLFPGMFVSPLQESILHKARLNGLVHVVVHDLRAFTHDKHKTADDRPYGGGAGMVMKIEPLVRAIEHVRLSGMTTRTVLLSPQGSLLSQDTARRLSTFQQVILICGRYEGDRKSVV